MTLDDLIAKVEKAYPLVGDYHREPDEDHGDTLAQFIARELRDTFCSGEDDEEQTAEARRVLEIAADQINEALSTLDD